jgi:hypothetical protein
LSKLGRVAQFPFFKGIAITITILI